MFSYHVLVGQTVHVGETVVRHSDTVASPAELILHYRCLNTSCTGLHEDTGIGADQIYKVSFRGNVGGIFPGSSNDIGV